MIIWFEKTAYPGMPDIADKTARLQRINAIIDLLYNAAEAASLNAAIKEYNFNDQQNQVKMVYQSPEAIVAMIKSYLSLKELILQTLPGHDRSMRLIDGKNILPTIQY